MRIQIKRISSFFLGLFILSFGISLTVISGLGAGAWDALAVGLSILSGFTPGTWVILIGVILIIINAVILKTRPEYIAIVTVLILGYFIDFWLLKVFSTEMVPSLMFQFILLFGGSVVMGLGIATYLQGKFAIIPIDRFMIAIQTRLNLKLMYSKTIAEVIALMFALLVGGPIGLGTIVVTFSIGPLIQLFFPHLEKIVQR
ncbi:MAG: membrane protein [Bacillaceae bacterium]|nr:membrane protein [Bacillaceae bacterium]